MGTACVYLEAAKEGVMEESEGLRSLLSWILKAMFCYVTACDQTRLGEKREGNTASAMFPFAAAATTITTTTSTTTTTTITTTTTTNNNNNNITS